MAEPLKNSFGPWVITRVAATVQAVHPPFDVGAFTAAALDGFEELELTPRARQVGDALAAHLPTDRAEALRILITSLDVEPPEDPDATEAVQKGMEGFFFLPHVYFVADYGLDHFDLAFEAQYELTKRFTAEFSIRSYIAADEPRTRRQLEAWTDDPSEHVRRLVSEGTRPRLPWAPRLDGYIADPEPVIGLLERLKDDPSEYVRRSVANNLNDIAKDHPDRVVEIAEAWWTDDRNRQRLLRHGMRTLIKQGHPGALAVLGYTPDSPLSVGPVVVEPSEAAIGERVRVSVELTNPTDRTLGALVDLRIHFVKANGSTSPKVFKGAEIELAPGEEKAVSKKISLAQHSTRTHHPGVHRAEVLVNGDERGATDFVVVEG